MRCRSQDPERHLKLQRHSLEQLSEPVVFGGYDTVFGELARIIGCGVRRMRLEDTSVSIRATLTAARANLAKAKVAT